MTSQVQSFLRKGRRRDIIISTSCLSLGNGKASVWRTRSHHLGRFDKRPSLDPHGAPCPGGPLPLPRDLVLVPRSQQKCPKTQSTLYYTHHSLADLPSTDPPFLALCLKDCGRSALSILVHDESTTEQALAVSISMFHVLPCHLRFSQQLPEQPELERALQSTLGFHITECKNLGSLISNLKPKKSGI